MLVTDPKVASNYGSGPIVVLVVGMTLLFGVIPTLMVCLFRLLIWSRNLLDMPESWPKLLVMWLCGTVSAYLCLRGDLYPGVPEWAWWILTVLAVVSIGFALLMIRQNQQLSTWNVWWWWIILPGMVLSSSMLCVFGN